MGLAAGYLTMTDSGKKITNELMEKGTKELNSFLKKEGVIEPNKDTRPPEYSDSCSEHEEQHSSDEAVN